MMLAFADFILDLSTRQLIRAGVVVPLEPKMYTLLELLVRRRPAVVTNVEIDETLWPNVYVARTSLTRLVSELRTVLGDSPRDPRIIRTAYKVGYAFCATIQTPACADPASSSIVLQWGERYISLKEGENIAGRGAEYSVVVDAPTVSRRHARIIVAFGEATIEDLGSSNGTSVNQKPISSPTRLKDGDEIALGSAALKIRDRDPAAKTELVAKK